MVTKPELVLRSGYGGLLASGSRGDVTTEGYALAQEAFQARKARNFILPIVREQEAHRILDVGCGMGAMAAELDEAGYESYGVDLPGLETRWANAGRRRDRFFLVDPDRFDLPFLDGVFDFAFSLGVIEHVGTVDGHSRRRPDWHEVRRQWVNEILRTVRPGGRLLLGGPNHGFPVDVAHAGDSSASRLERALSDWFGATVHRTWGDHFLWSYSDVRRYLQGVPCQIEPRGVADLLEHSRVPGPLRGLAQAYLRGLPRRLLGSGFNPWMMVLITRDK